MGGPNLEVFKFGMYIFFPIGWMYYFGTNLDQRFSVPDFWPAKEETNTIPFEREDIAAELQRLKAKRLEGRERRLAMLRAQGVDEEELERQGLIRKGESPILKSLGHAGDEGRVTVEEVREKDKGNGWTKFW